MGSIEQWGLALALVLPVLLPVQMALFLGQIVAKRRLKADIARFAALRAITSGRRAK